MLQGSQQGGSIRDHSLNLRQKKAEPTPTFIGSIPQIHYMLSAWEIQ